MSSKKNNDETKSPFGFSLNLLMLYGELSDKKDMKEVAKYMVENHDTILSRLKYENFQEPDDIVEQFFVSDFVKKYSPDISDFVNKYYDSLRKNKFK